MAKSNSLKLVGVLQYYDADTILNDWYSGVTFKVINKNQTVICHTLRTDFASLFYMCPIRGIRSVKVYSDF